MSNTAYTRAVEDLRNAGLNPMLAYSQGGASTPNHSAATVIPEDAVARGVSSAADKSMQTMLIAQQQANIELTQAQTKKTLEEAATAAVTSALARDRQEAEIANLKAEYRAILEREDLTRWQRQQIEDMLPKLVAQLDAQIANTIQSTSASKTQQHLSELDVPESEANAELWKLIQEQGKAAQLSGGAIRQLFEATKQYIMRRK